MFVVNPLLDAEVEKVEEFHFKLSHGSLSKNRRRLAATISKMVENKLFIIPLTKLQVYFE